MKLERNPGLNAAICYFYYKDSPSMKLSKSIAPYGSVELELTKNKNDAVSAIKTLFEASVPESIFIFGEVRELDCVSIEAYAGKNSERLGSNGDVKRLSKAMTEYGIPNTVNDAPRGNTADAVYHAALNCAYKIRNPARIILINLPPLKKTPDEDFDKFCAFINRYIEGEHQYLNRLFLK